MSNDWNETYPQHPPHGHRNPYLAYQPHFAFSLPVQILCNGIILTLAAVLLIHLILTIQYHWALARTNYTLQLSAVVTLCISLISTTIVIFESVHRDSRKWPYMLDYIAVDVPKDGWSLTEQVLWYTLEALTSGLAHITHIQFLTLMYPSKLETRLIFILIGPLAIASSAMQFCSLASNKRAQDLGDAIRGVCNTTLALLFSAALFIWGFGVNRKRAWRTDGGTAAFGAAAIILSGLSVAINFVLIFVDDLTWLPALSWAVVLWQTFLGWWWWVGGGMSIGEVEDMLYREQKRKDERRQKRLKQQSKRDRRQQGSRRRIPDGTGERHWVDTIVPNLLTRRRMPRRNDTMDVATEQIIITAPSERGLDTRSTRSTATRRARHSRRTESRSDSPEEIELSDIHPATDHRRRADEDDAGSFSSDPSASSNTISVPRPLQSILFVPTIYTTVVRALRTLTRAHHNEVVHTATAAAGADDNGGGWGLGSNGLREREEAENRIREFQQRRRSGILVRNAGEMGEDDDDGEDSAEDIDEDRGREGERDSYPPSSPSRSRSQSQHSPVTPRNNRPPLTHRDSDTATQASLPHPLPPSDSLFWRWGPLRRWRLQDRTSY